MNNIIDLVYGQLNRIRALNEEPIGIFLSCQHLVEIKSDLRIHNVFVYDPRDSRNDDIEPAKELFSIDLLFGVKIYIDNKIKLPFCVGCYGTVEKVNAYEYRISMKETGKLNFMRQL